MNEQELIKLNNELSSLTVFRPLLADGVLSALRLYFDTVGQSDKKRALSAYADFVSRLYTESAGDLTAYIEQICFNSENVYVKMLGRGDTPPKCICESVDYELSILGKVASLTPADLTDCLDFGGFVPPFDSHSDDLPEKYGYRARNIQKYGYGKYAANQMFYLDSDCNIVPVKNPDKISLSELVDYEYQRRIIINNTKALINGKPAANILLTGDAGTGKSSTVKAVANEFFGDGLRIIEVRKEQLNAIPKVLDELAQNPLKFILFIDDLSFSSDDDNFNGLKAVLEGSVSARSNNTVVYATSNRRHIVKERFSDRDGDEIHRNDSMQEMISLSNRFGIHITFSKPDKTTYLNIVKQLANQCSVKMDDSELELRAERFALERGGRSARLAKQFIDGILSES